MHEEDDDAHDDEEEGVGVEHQDLQALLGGQVGLGVGVTAAVADISGLHDGKKFVSDTRYVKHETLNINYVPNVISFSFQHCLNNFLDQLDSNRTHD